MAKRRFQADPDREKAPEELSPEERRARRREERSRSARGKRPREERTGWRRALVPGAVATTIVVVILVLWFGVGLLFPHPCLSFQPIPAQSGIPAFPASNVTDFTQTWCPTATTLFSIHPLLEVQINGQTVGFPPSIGRNANFTGHECDLPIHTQPGLAAGVFNVTSPWPYQYTLGDFFSVWQSSYTSAYVNASYSTRTIDYTATQLLGLPADSKHTITLFVDNQPSSSGPGLVLNALNNVAGSSPSCIDSVYGSGHTIVLVYKTASAGAAIPGPIHPTLTTGLPPHLIPTSDAPSALPTDGGALSARAAIGPPPWLLLRVAP